MTRIVWTVLFLGFLSVWNLSAQEEADGCRRAFDGIKTSMLTVLGNAQGGSCEPPFDVDLQKTRSNVLESANVALDNGEWFEVDAEFQDCPDRKSHAELAFGVIMVSGTMSKQKFLKITVPSSIPYMVSDEDLSVVPNMCMVQAQWFLEEEDNPRVPNWNPAYAGYQYWVDLLKYRDELDPIVIKGGAFMFSNKDAFTLDILERIDEAESSD